MGKPGYTGVKRVVKAAGYSYQGISAALKNEAAFRQEALLFLVLTPLAFYLGDSALEILLLVSSLLIVLIVELLNSAIEAIVDRVGTEHHELSGRAKDMGSAAVFISLVLVFITWVTLIFLN
jgi:diacylglycerol kinase (ATP)